MVGKWKKIKSYYYPKGLVNEHPWDKDNPEEKTFEWRLRVPTKNKFSVRGRIERSSYLEEYPFTIVGPRGRYYSLEEFDYYREVE